MGSTLKIFALAFLATGSAGHFRPIRVSHLPPSYLRDLRTKAFALFQARSFLEAARLYSLGYQEAVRLDEDSSALHFLNGLGGARFAMFQYREAMHAFVDARQLALQMGDWEMLAAVAANISSLYLQQQELNAGKHAADQALEALRRAGATKFGPLLRTQSAISDARLGRWSSALVLFQEALQEAEAQGDTRTASMIWDQLGYEFLQRGLLEDAEQALLEAFRVRALTRSPDLQYSYYTLGMLRRAQGDARMAARLLDLSLARAADVAGTLPVWRIYYERGLARMAEGKSAGALADFQRSLASARLLRLEILPADSIWINTSVDQSRLCSALIRAASALYAKTENPAYAQLAFEAAEQDRAAGLRALVYSPAEWRKRLPAEYWETLAQLRAAEAASLGPPAPTGSAVSRTLRFKLTEMEAQAGLHLPFAGAALAQPEASALERIRRSLRADEAFFSFHLDEPQSLLWVVTSRSFRVLRLPAGARINALSDAFQRATRLGLPQAAALGEQLYLVLFGAVEGEARNKSQWLLALDGDLFRVPFAALVTGRREGRPAFLTEQHVTRIVPSALLLEAKGDGRWAGPFVGVADPIYNAADPRRSETGLRRALWFRRYLRGLPQVLARSSSSPSMETARLPGSALEIAACVQAWGAPSSDAILLTGGRAALGPLSEALAHNPSILHFATHFFQSAGDERQALIALSLGRDGWLQLLSPAEISRWRLRLDLVVLSGCASASAEALPVEGLMGMTRAWLAAGARALVASLWPTPDDRGKLFVSFYGHLAELKRAGGGAAAEALRRAQLDMLNSGSWHSSPTFWAAYIVAGKE